MANVKSLIKDLQNIPNHYEVLGFDIKILNPKTKSAQHLFSIELDQEEQENPKEKEQRIGF